jgi:hypothetical protein
MELSLRVEMYLVTEDLLLACQTLAMVDLLVEMVDLEL